MKLVELQENRFRISLKMMRNNPEKSVNAYNSLKDWGMQMLIGTTTSKPCTAVVEKTHEDNMFHLTPSATAVESIQYDNAFRMCFSDPNQGTSSATYIGEHQLASKVAVIYDSSYPTPLVFMRILPQKQKIVELKL